MKFLKSALAAGLVGVFAATSAGAATLTFDPAVACDNGVVTSCVANHATDTTDAISNAYGDLPGLLDVSFVSSWPASGTHSAGSGPVYYWDTGYGSLNHVAIGGHPDGGGYGAIVFDVTGAASVTVTSFDIANAPSPVNTQGDVLMAGSLSVWFLKDFSSGTVLQSGSFSGTEAASQSILLAGGTGFTSTQGFVLEWLNDAGFSTFVGVDNVQYSVTASAVPEASNLAMLLAGLGVVGAVSRRRQRKAA